MKVLILALSLFAAVVAETENAYATLLYGDDFLLGVRVLGESIRSTGTKADLVAIVTGQMSQKGKQTLRRDGWKVKTVDTIQNPGKGPQSGKGFPPQFSAVYTKLTIFNLTEYKKVVYLDADTVVLKNSDDLFDCPGFCAALRHSERFNSGVMVVTPSTETYEDMISKIGSTTSYTGGDQGFLNEYFEGFINAYLFDPDDVPNDTKVDLVFFLVGYKLLSQMMRLETGYNADIGLYILNSNRWMIPKERLKIVHYTLGPFKPWNWWTGWVISDLKAWQKFRHQLPRDSSGIPQGMTPGQRFCIYFLSWIPYLLVAVFYHRYFYSSNESSPRNGKSDSVPSTSSAPHSHSIMSRTGLPKRFVGNSIIIGYVTLLVAAWTVLYFIPNEIFPFWGWLLAYEWVIFIHGSLFSLYLKYCYDTGHKTGASNLPTFKFASWSNPWRVTIKSLISSAALLLVTPWVSSLLFVSSFIGKVVVTVVCGLILCVMLTHVYSTLPIRWFSYGRNESSGKNMSF